MDDWLPDLISLDEYGGDSERYIEAVYEIFTKDFILRRVKFQGLDVLIPRDPFDRGKESCFWHLTSKGPREEDRIPDLRRCERIRWIRPIIECSDANLVRSWDSERKLKGKKKKRTLLAIEDFSYVIVLTRLPKYFVLITAFPIENPHQMRNFRRQWEDWKRSQK